jgi:hypothetical protein
MLLLEDLPADLFEDLPADLFEDLPADLFGDLSADLLDDLTDDFFLDSYFFNDLTGVLVLYYLFFSVFLEIDFLLSLLLYVF